MNNSNIKGTGNEKTYPMFQVIAGGISKGRAGDNVVRGPQPYYIIEYVLSGRGTVMLPGYTCEPGEGSVYILPAHTPHRYFSAHSNPWEKIFFIASGTLIPVLLNSFELSDTYFFPESGVKKLFTDLHTLKLPLTRENQWQAQQIFHTLLYALRAKLPVITGENDTLAGKIKKCLDSSIYSKITISQISSRIGICKAQIIRVCKSAFGVTPYEYILRKRIESSEILLLGTALTIREIAIRLNFSDEFHFSRCFKKRKRCTPYRFRTGGKREL